MNSCMTVMTDCFSAVLTQTLGKCSVVLIAELKALGIAVGRRRTQQRTTRPAERLRLGISSGE